MLYRDRREAGRILALELRRFADRQNLIVLGLPRGGIPVAYEVARARGAPLDALVVRKLGVPGREELAMGALATGGTVVWNREVIAALDIADNELSTVLQAKVRELQRLEQLLREGRP